MAQIGVVVIPLFLSLYTSAFSKYIPYYFQLPEETNVRRSFRDISFLILEATLSCFCFPLRVFLNPSYIQQMMQRQPDEDGQESVSEMMRRASSDFTLVVSRSKSPSLGIARVYFSAEISKLLEHRNWLSNAKHSRSLLSLLR